MTRREEVEAKIESVDWAYDWEGDALALRGLCRILADEVDALRAEADPDALTICYMQGQAAGRDAERDRLAAENAELRKQCAAFHTEASDHYRAFLAANAELERVKKTSGYARVALTDEWKKIHDQIQAENAELREQAEFLGNKFSHDLDQADRRVDQWQRCFEIAFKLKNKYYHELAAANASLDRLRDAMPEVLPLHMSWKDALDGARAILYPQPEKDNEQ